MTVIVTVVTPCLGMLIWCPAVLVLASAGEMATVASVCAAVAATVIVAGPSLRNYLKIIAHKCLERFMR